MHTAIKQHVSDSLDVPKACHGATACAAFLFNNGVLLSSSTVQAAVVQPEGSVPCQFQPPPPHVTGAQPWQVQSTLQ
jgi:hypothetical protein